MPSAYYISCDVPPQITSGGSEASCTQLNGAEVLTLVQIENSFGRVTLTNEQALEMYPYFLTVVVLAWGFKQIGRTMELR